VSQRVRIEWPPGSGRAANYTEAERELMNDLRRQCEEGEITFDQLARQVNAIHDLKVYLDASLIEEEPKPTKPEEPPEQSSLFPIPEKARRTLEGGNHAEPF
jgi:hypothetical protein